MKENVFTANRASNLARSLAKQQRDLASVGNFTTWGLPKMDKYLNPMMAGDLVTIIGRPQNGKTLLGMYLLDKKVKEIAKSGHTNKAAIIVTAEVSVERLILYQMAKMAKIDVSSVLRGEITDDQFKDLDLAALRVGSLPLFIIGHSTKRSKEGKRKRPALTPYNIDLAIEYIMNEYIDHETGSYIEPDIVVVDYLQRLHKPPRVERREHMEESVNWSKDLSLWAGCPVVLLCQAGRQVDSKSVRIPQMDDGQWTSNIEQSSDLSFGAWMPKTLMSNRLWEIAVSELGFPRLPFTDKLLILQCLKQKEGPAGELFSLYVEPGILKIGEFNIMEYK